MSWFDQVVYLTKRCWHTPVADCRYPLAFLGSMVIRMVTILFSVYIVLWITSFIDTGVLQSESDAKTVYIEMLAIAIVCSLFCLPVVGFIADRAPPYIFIPIAFGVRGLSVFGFNYL